MSKKRNFIIPKAKVIIFSYTSEFNEILSNLGFYPTCPPNYNNLLKKFNRNCIKAYK